MEVSQVWEYGRNLAERIYSGSRGDADWLDVRGNVLITFADISYIGGATPSPYSVDARMTRIIEVTHDAMPEVVFDLALFDFEDSSSEYGGFTAYRARRIADLYPTVLNVAPSSPTPGRLAVSWNAIRNYRYRLSTSQDLAAWQPVATAVATNELMSAEVELGGTNHFFRVERLYGP